jgi:hypothetical protein
VTDPQGAVPPPVLKHSHTAPFIYFDVAPTYGVMAGAIEIELVARILIPSTEPQPKAEAVTTAHLRCSPVAAASLRDALNKALEMHQQFQDQAIALVAAIGTGTAH